VTGRDLHFQHLSVRADILAAAIEARLALESTVVREVRMKSIACQCYIGFLAECEVIRTFGVARWYAPLVEGRINVLIKVSLGMQPPTSTRIQ
jgi:hypothetical protein